MCKSDERDPSQRYGPSGRQVHNHVLCLTVRPLFNLLFTTFMKRLTLLLAALLVAALTPLTPARGEVNVSIDFFYDALSPHGDWVYSDDYGYVWQPTVAQQGDWAPYTDGYWSYTDGGWTWVSNEDFGWATYHYGRWIRLDDYWTWVPGYEWAPAWVSWRETEDDHVGWAPLPPEASWSASIGFNRWADSYYDIGPSYYNFVPLQVFGRQTSLRPVIIDRSRNVTYINRSVNITNITYRNNVINNVFVGGPDPDRIDRRSQSPIRRLRLQRDDEGFRRDWLGPRGERGRDPRSLSRIEDDRLFVAAPGIRREDSPRLPSRVRERIERAEVDRGWRNAGGDDRSLQTLRERQREELEKNRPDNLPPKRPTLVTGKVPPPAVGRVLRPEERRAGVKRPGPGETEEGMRRGDENSPRSGPRDMPPGPGDRPGRDERDMRPGPDGRAPGNIPGRPGLDNRDGRPERDERGPGMNDRERGPRPGPDGRTPTDDNRSRDDRREPGTVPGRPGMDNRDNLPGPDGRRPGERPGAGMPDNDSRERRPGVKPDEAPRPRMAPGVVPDDGNPRRPGGAPENRPAPGRQDSPPAPRSERPEAPKPPATRPELPKVRPDAPTNRPTPMPEARPKAETRSTPAPKAEPKGRPVPMPKPDRPSASENRRKESPDVKAAKPQSSPAKSAPASRPKPAQKTQSAPPQTRKAAPQPRTQAAAPKRESAAPKVRPKAAPKAAPKKAAEKKKD